MDWENKLKELSNYDVAFEIRQGYYHVSIVFQDGWDVILPENENIYVEKRKGIYHYIASTDAIKVDDIFSAIDNTIEYNLDLEKKLELFKQKTEELQELFSKENYETLKTIEFKLAKRKVKKKKEQDKPKENVVTELKETDANTVSVTDNITSVTSKDYDSNEEVVVMNNDFIEELERK